MPHTASCYMTHLYYRLTTYARHLRLCQPLQGTARASLMRHLQQQLEGLQGPAAGGQRPEQPADTVAMLSDTSPLQTALETATRMQANFQFEPCLPASCGGVVVFRYIESALTYA